MSTQSLSVAELFTSFLAFAETKGITFTVASGETEVETVVQAPSGSSRSRCQPSAAAKTDNHRRLPGYFQSKATTTAAKLRKGEAFALKDGGSMYTVTSVLRTATKVTLGTDHPKVEQMTLAAERQVIRCTKR